MNYLDFLNSATAIVNTACSRLERAANIDARYWTEMQVAQDSEECEASGYLEGFRDGLNAVQTLLVHQDSKTLTEFVQFACEQADERERNLEEEDELSPNEQAVLNIKSAIRVIAPLWEDMKKFGHTGADDVAGAQSDLEQAVRFITKEEVPS